MSTQLSTRHLLRTAWHTFRRAWLPVVATQLGLSLIQLIVVSPLIAWLFKEALRANGMLALDFGALHFTSGIGMSFALLVVILMLVFWIGALQFVVLVQMLHLSQTGSPLTARSVMQRCVAVAKKLIRPSSAPLFWYLFFILPLSGFGFVSVLSQGIAVPSFISGELLKSQVNATIWVVFLLSMAFLNLRFAASLPIFTLTAATGGRAMRLSWKLTRGWASVKLLIAAFVLLVAASAITLVLVAVTIVPTAITDDAAPAASPVVAAFSLGAAHLLGMALTSVITALFTALLLALVQQRGQLLPEEVLATAGAGDPRDKLAGPHHTSAEPPRKTALTALVAAGVVVAAGLGASHIGTIQQLSQHPQTLSIGHRGFSGGGAENTIEGLEAAAAAGADMVEIDVMQTADAKFVVMHDANLSRLAGLDANVKDLTLAELTQITVRDLAGHEGKIPTLEQYVRRAAELEMPLLIEIKLGGLDTADFVSLLVDELEALDAMQNNIFHSLDRPSVDQLKALRPDATVGYILAFAAVDVPDTVADFVVIEEWSATQKMQDAAARKGLGFFSWTVNDEAGMHELLRRNAHGIITDHPDKVTAARSDMQSETGLADTLIDALTRFVVVF